MKQLKCISSSEAIDLISHGAAVVDIRDAQSFSQGHIPDSFNLSNDNLHEYIAQADFDTPLLVCCYHGISSQSAGQFLLEQGFDEVYSINGGFEAWHAEHPELCNK